ncbi:hypothetical protein PTTG_29501 [Puccinia triticina 1-1 BBBD Race 1]|uniref:protein-serine/threonine phosphatase n=2 Tax=Puccinia triticina TaxID=208348 RepID=A0A180G3Q2_PUCT1|nr:uncharacterized protein PtA15_4A668 [Puccinia triticina]OAV87281.1 hypothetical protein PTTG_29501 [Puccinia triticina 1-1 BBBD Race 1]WAQ84216.1 hypothetical protein PtA15_4A668 [Puccinia triticina]WAR55043.1 hypothetical protein PtB15_4B662 [Puccinia triticina]
MSHGPSTLTVSVLEAQRLESETRTRLLKAQKLLLIVDLDQTIIHATVNPTVGEWMADPTNPNWPALQGVSRFQSNDPPNLPNKGCYYNLKQRPGLADFLHSPADKYEMHVYTMGTRHMRMLSARLLIRQAKSSATGSSVGTKAAPPPPAQLKAPASASAPTDPVALPIMTVTDVAGTTSALAKAEQLLAILDGSLSGAGPTSKTIASVQASKTSAVPPTALSSSLQSPKDTSTPPSLPETTTEEQAKTARSKLIAD